MVARPTPRSAVYAGLGHSDAHNACNRVCAALAHHRKGRLERRREWPAAGLLKESTSQGRSSATSAASARTPAACFSGVFSVKNDFCSCDMSHSLACASGVIIPGVGHTPPVERAPVGASKLHPASHSGVLFLSRFAPAREEYRL